MVVYPPLSLLFAEVQIHEHCRRTLAASTLAASTLLSRHFWASLNFQSLMLSEKLHFVEKLHLLLFMKTTITYLNMLQGKQYQKPKESFFVYESGGQTPKGR